MAMTAKPSALRRERARDRRLERAASIAAIGEIGQQSSDLLKRKLTRQVAKRHCQREPDAAAAKRVFDIVSPSAASARSTPRSRPRRRSVGDLGNALAALRAGRANGRSPDRARPSLR